MTRKIQFHPRRKKNNNKKVIFYDEFCAKEKNYDYHTPNLFLITFSEGIWSCLGWRERFQWHSCMWWRCLQSYFIYWQPLFLYFMGYTEVKENDVKDTLHDKRQKNSSIRNLLTKKCENHKLDQQALQKVAKIIF